MGASGFREGQTLEITEIRIKLMEESEDRLRAFCSITLDDCFVIRDLKIIDGSNGPFVAMPSRKLTGNCHRCRYKNQMRANYCNHCGAKQRTPPRQPQINSPKLYADVAHPINSECREMIQSAVLTEFEEELGRYQEPGYRSRYDDDFTTELDGSGAVDASKIDPPETTLPKPHLPPETSHQESLEADDGSRATDAATPQSVSGDRDSDARSPAPISPAIAKENDLLDSFPDDGFGQGIF